jgi:glycosyltransferase involved in cell wall biosynthesis
MVEKQSLIFLSMRRWDTIQQRPHHLALAFSNKYRVLYVDPIAYSILGYIEKRIKGDQSRNLNSIVRQINENLVVYTPPPLLPFSESNKTMNYIVHSFLIMEIKRLAKNFGIRQPILWTNFPTHVATIGKLEESLVCYDCMDNYPAFFPATSRRNILINQLETELLDHADVVITTARSLQEKFKIRGYNAYYIPNGVGEQFISFTPTQPETDLNDWPTGKGPVIGYAGYISRWLDFDAIIQLATKHPDWRFVFIGPADIDLQKYRLFTNIYFLDPKPYTILTEYVARFDVATIPFIINDLTKDVNPVKIYEYFALGKPVVASKIPELIPYESVCYLAESTTELINQVEKAVLESITKDNLEIDKQRRSIAVNNTWEARSEEISNILASHVSTSRART